MEAIFSSETSVDIQRTTRRYIPEDGSLQLDAVWDQCCHRTVTKFGAMMAGGENTTWWLQVICECACVFVQVMEPVSGTRWSGIEWCLSGWKGTADPCTAPSPLPVPVALSHRECHVCDYNRTAICLALSRTVALWQSSPGISAAEEIRHKLPNIRITKQFGFLPFNYLDLQKNVFWHRNACSEFLCSCCTKHFPVW
jgi:hypothetical protein